MSKVAELLLIYTGGTIGMVEDAESGALHPLNFDQLEKEIPELKKLECNITVKSLKVPIDL
jgi:L-asparaginase